MLDLKFVRENPKLVEEAVKSRNGSLDLTEFLALDKKRREITQQVEALKKERNTASQEIGKLKKAGQDAAEQMAAVRALGDKIAADDKELKEIEEKIKSILLTIPNVPAEDVPVGKDDTCTLNLESSLNRESLILNQRLTGISVKTWAFWISNVALRLAVHVMYSIVAWAPVWSVPLSTSFWMYTPESMAIPNSSRRSSLTVQACRALANCRNLPRICTSWKTVICT